MKLLYSLIVIALGVQGIALISTPVIEKESELTIDGMPGSVILAKAAWKKGPQNAVTVYQVMLLDGQRYFLAQGFAPEAEAEKYIEVFAKITESIKRKP